MTPPVLITGSTGYVGGRLIPRLIEAGHRVRAMGRSLSKLRDRPWAGHPAVELVQGDVLDAPSLSTAVSGCRAAYYLVHSMNPTVKDFARADRQGAFNMARAAAEAGLSRLIYLGGLAPLDQSLSPHLRSRSEVGDILASGPVPVTYLRAAMILGSGSASFEILRYLVERLPIMITPRWVRSRVQPICIRNVLTYLAGCLDVPETIGQTFDIGGPEILTYQELFQIYAREAGLRKRMIIPVPVLSPKLSSYWIHFVTPVHASIAQPLAEGLRHSVICRENRIRDLIPDTLLDCRQAIRRAIEKDQQRIVETCWTDAGTVRPPEWIHQGDAPYAGGTIFNSTWRARIQADPEELWEQIIRIGGDTGWYFADALWRFRGAIDKLFGGVSLKRGRRHPTHLQVGDALDFWRVLEIRRPHTLVLAADMKAPGEALLELNLTPAPNGTDIELRAEFLPKGLPGLLYWYALLPVHRSIFSGILRRMARTANRPIIKGPAPVRKPGPPNNTFDSCDLP